MIWRLQMLVRRLLEFICRWPSSFHRWLLWMPGLNVPEGKHWIWRWLAGVLLATVDLTPLPLCYETLLEWVKMRSRPLRPDEVELIRSIFGSALRTELITMDPDALPARRKTTTAYVSFHTIQFSGDLHPATLIHEGVHVWQYQHWGSIYISEALWAQHWGGGYNYGGTDRLAATLKTGGLRQFNFEQQAEIIEDYYRSTVGLPLQWALPGPDTTRLLQQYKNQLV